MNYYSKYKDQNSIIYILLDRTQHFLEIGSDSIFIIIVFKKEWFKLSIQVTKTLSSTTW